MSQRKYLSSSFPVAVFLIGKILLAVVLQESSRADGYTAKMRLLPPFGRGTRLCLVPLLASQEGAFPENDISYARRTLEVRRYRPALLDPQFRQIRNAVVLVVSFVIHHVTWGDGVLVNTVQRIIDPMKLEGIGRSHIGLIA